jgi:hypothetical protein
MSKLLTQIRTLTVLFIIVLVISGITVFPLYTEIKWILEANILHEDSAVHAWLIKVSEGISQTQKQFPFLFYGFDWLAFAHLIIAVLFIGVYQHPLRNRWIIQWAMISCISVLPLAFFAGTVRGIPFFHILIDCSFGVIGFIPLYFMQLKINKLKKYRSGSRSNRNAELQ